MFARLNTLESIYDQHLDKQPGQLRGPVAGELRRAQRRGLRRPAGRGARRAPLHLGPGRERSARLAAALRALGVGRGSTVSVMLPNTPEMVEAHYAVPALNAVLNTLNTRLDAPLLAWQMNHCEAEVLITDREFSPTMGPSALALR
jgi:fatty-acyl-CoA synthase